VGVVAVGVQDAGLEVEPLAAARVLGEVLEVVVKVERRVLGVEDGEVRLGEPQVGLGLVAGDGVGGQLLELAQGRQVVALGVGVLPLGQNGRRGRLRRRGRR